jgi:septal ring factor EnvC (AmiA/AmiB activator)
MKNAFIALALVLVVSSAFASHEAETKARLQKIAANSFGKTILETIQVELKSKDDPRPRIIELLEEIENEIIQDQAAADAGHQADTDHHNAVVDQIEGELSDLESDLDENTQLASDLQTGIDQANADLSTQNDLIDSYNAELASAEDAWNTVDEAWSTADNKYGRILDVLGQVRGIITQRLATRYNAEFLQAAHSQILGSFAQVKESVNDKAFKRMSPGFSRLISFITMKVESHLSQDQTEEDEEAQAELTSIVTLIDSIAAGVEQERVANNDWHDDQHQQWDDISSTLSTSISAAQSSVDNLDNQITDLTARLSTANTDISNDSDRIAQLEDQLSTENNAFATLSADYSTSTHDRTAQLELIQEVLDIVENQLSGLRQYAEDYIGSH